MFPNLIDLGFIHLRTYGACMAIGFILCWKLFEVLSRRRDLSNFILALMVSGILGARIAYVIEHWTSEFAGHPERIVRIDQGGLMFYGGFILAFIVYFVWCHVRRERPLALADHFAAVIPLGHAFGRIGCFFYGCCYGKLSESALAVRFPRCSPAWYEQYHAGLIPYTAESSLAVLPTQLFEAAALLALFAGLFFLDRRNRREGLVTGVYLVGYAAIRFALECLRGDPRAAVWIFSISQSISLVLAVFGVAVIAIACSRRKI